MAEKVNAQLVVAAVTPVELVQCRHHLISLPNISCANILDSVHDSNSSDHASQSGAGTTRTAPS
jgi:hypothetical protein